MLFLQYNLMEEVWEEQEVTLPAAFIQGTEVLTEAQISVFSGK